MASITYHARNAVAKFSATAVTIGTSTTLAQSFSSGSAFTAKIKDVSITPPEGAVDLVNYLGEDSNGFQNSAFEEKAHTAASINGTMVISNVEDLELLFGGSGTSTGTAAYMRFQYGSGTSSKTRVKVGGILVSLDNGTDVLNVVLNNIMITKLGDIKVTGTDGHWERGFEGMCRPADYYEEYKN